MTVRKVGNRWHVVKKNGKLGKGTFMSEATAKKAQARGRALHGGRSPAKSPKRSPSSPAGGGKSTSSVAKLGVIFRRARTALNLTAPGWGAFRPGQGGVDGELEGQLARTVRRYSGMNVLTDEFDLRHALPSYEGIGVSLANDWFDRKMRNSARISRGKLFPILSEGIPLLRARLEVPASANHPLYEAARNYNKRVTGYDPTTHTHEFRRVEEYAAGKLLVAGYNKVVPGSWKAAANRMLPKGFNPF